jgi:multiple sugar transport system permease protein
VTQQARAAAMRGRPAPQRAPMQQRLRRGVGDGAVMLALAVAVAVALFPVVWTLLSSLKPAAEIFTFPPTFVFEPTLDHYRVVLSGDIAAPMLNTLIVTVGSVALALSAGSLAGYALARFQTGVFRAMGLFVFSMRFLPTIVIILPLFVMYSGAGLSGSRFGLILAYQLFTLPLSIWITWGFFAQVPPELEQAAMIDGCSRFQAFWHVALPIALPGIGAAAVVATIMAWNQFLIPLILGGAEARVITTEIARYSGGDETTADWGPLAALAVVIAGPVIVAGLALNRYLLRGLLRDG